MAPSSGHLLVPKALKIVESAITKTTALLRSKLPAQNIKADASLQPVRVYAQNQPLTRRAFLQQFRGQQSRPLNTQSRTLTSTATKAQSGLKYDRSKFPVSKARKILSQRGTTPFASTLRPNLTGGVLPRTAGGYSIGGAGKARLFSHTAGCQAQVVHNVNAGIRAFVIGGGKTRYDGCDPMTGEKRFRAVSNTEDKVYNCFDRSSNVGKGTSLVFCLSPTVTALFSTPTQSVNEMGTTLQTSNLLVTLSSDFARSLQSLSLILNDLNRLSTFGDLPVFLTHTLEGPAITVRFPGCDADLVSRLCDEVGVTRGIMKEDEAWHEIDGDKEVQMALLFPFAPTDQSLDVESDIGQYFEMSKLLEQQTGQEQLDWRNMISPSNRTIRSDEGSDMSFEEATLRSPMFTSKSPSGYESMEEVHGWTPSSRQSAMPSDGKAASGSQEYEGLEGIYKFLQVCDESRR